MGHLNYTLRYMARYMKPATMPTVIVVDAGLHTSLKRRTSDGMKVLLLLN